MKAKLYGVICLVMFLSAMCLWAAAVWTGDWRKLWLGVILVLVDLVVGAIGVVVAYHEAQK
jgi:fatty-acid desaturase